MQKERNKFHGDEILEDTYSKKPHPQRQNPLVTKTQLAYYTIGYA
jgi:hypothetical protein